MLASKYRLKKNNDFIRLARLGREIFVKEISLKYVKNNFSYSRFGLVVSLKVDKKAVVRNKIKRRIRAVLRKHLPQIVSGYDFLILIKPEIKQLTYRQLEEEILKLFQKQNFIIKK